MKRAERAKRIANGLRMLEKFQNRTRESIERDCQQWSADYELSDAHWTNDLNVVGFTGEQKNGDHLIYYFSVVDVPGIGPEILQIKKIATKLECDAARGSHVSPYLNISADAYNQMQRAVANAKLGILPV